MPDIPIEFISEEVEFTLKDVDKVKNWIAQVIAEHQLIIDNITYIFCSDEYLYNINQTYLNHDTYTDIITFDNSDEEDTIESDIFISIDRVKENASQLNIPFQDELHRVIIHGVLHLIGYDDKDESSKAIMRQKENDYLSLRDFS
ncbi:rRNA maturation RNase YbeY [Adhaeribacter radiodurans]|uniref:Endoribonuclease YbeY n=1 Tax=Adhaeribacter radiodurans TaxID=2745197 RepID=A0A7L7LEA0_9BACT|nr:rRNA maturation RNase YbeY [Adhaeribacter radiodurans]QMU31077.1 rRNA maturation RNase YbeY [Adhaeribacter radiodurans]